MRRVASGLYLGTATVLAKNGGRSKPNVFLLSVWAREPRAPSTRGVTLTPFLTRDRRGLGLTSTWSL